MDIFSAFGLSASAGLNAYIPLLTVAILARFTNLITLQEPWDALSSWWMIGILVVLSLIEFFADKVPAINHFNDLLQTLIRPVAGAIVFAASSNMVTDIHPVLSMAMGLFVAGSVHAVKSLAVRPAVSATTAGAGNVPISILEDVISAFVSILAIVVPILIAAVVILATVWIILWMWRRSKRRSYSA
jgi:hypothetical protein